jgi:hypothetical protein
MQLDNLFQKNKKIKIEIVIKKHPPLITLLSIAGYGLFFTSCPASLSLSLSLPHPISFLSNLKGKNIEILNRNKWGGGRME